MKACTKCGETKPLAEFNRHARHPTGYKSACRACQRIADKEYRTRNAETESLRKRAVKYRARFNISLDELDQLLAAVNYRCEACGTHRDDTHNKALVLDHDHACCPSERTCGKCIRGVLCTKCNVALGALNDNIDKLRALLGYMEANSGARRIQAA